ncbi:bifunctional proline dehydrogenase/L-glutamate gamma-semialdehyde dehydrogenase PutA [Thiotrichales bacterium 19S3-7]|nr:bifunctional proline dehydrogenase/L-glutamate gamma-semialdehyde dehydrogenase PutA [Thiotrichales bacterium 19S3-7]MCF6801931.1 bifunctional proline dehydrogenase/L-glutamate gamma-semialdehyde dehydrogenase PutA [Thiotrichales bacterium 19S3-11]
MMKLSEVSLTYRQNPLITQISNNWSSDEHEIVQSLANQAQLNKDQIEQVQAIASELVAQVRRERLSKSGLDAFMVQYDLSSSEGIVLMCLAESLLRIPDKITADKLIRDKLTAANWNEHLGKSESLFVNAATWSLMLTGKLIHKERQSTEHFSKTLKNFLSRRSAPVIRSAVKHAMKVLGKQYVMGETIGQALKRARGYEKIGYRYSYDMLGEAARTMKDAEFYFQEYTDAINAIGRSESAQLGNVKNNAGISVKLSALHPRYEVAQSDRVHKQLYPKLLELMELAKSYNIGLNIDAEETERLEISLELIERLAAERSLEGWQGLGIVVQAYQKRASFVLDYLIDLAKRTNHRFMVRLVKGAYWDAEIKHAQEEGLKDYPVFTRKCYTDVSYQACAKKILDNTQYIYPQFATHNALSVATILELAGEYRDFEFQCLHGMGTALYDHVVGEENFNIATRIYAPVGTHEHLLPYLVRRLLENGANSSFVNRIVDEKVPIEQLVKDPVEKAKSFEYKPHSQIALPRYIYGEDRMNSKGYNINDIATLEKLSHQMQASYGKKEYFAKPMIEGIELVNGKDRAIDVISPSTGESVGKVLYATSDQSDIAFDGALNAFESWRLTTADERAQCLDKMADLLEENMPELMAIAINEAGKTLANAVSEVREAIDFCRYYAQQAREHFSEPKILPGPTGELNQISLHGRGVIVCISPWNFPLAIFLGQVAAALAAGNVVIAKPAEQTSLIAFEAVKLFHKAGIPLDVLQLLPGTGEEVGARLIAHPKVAGVVFTGSTEVARIIQKTLANKPGAIVPLIAETGGQNAMVVDSSALPEQVVNDVVNSSFDSAGQRCSALRVLFLQSDVADNIIEMLKGAMKELIVGNPNDLKTDIGPVIDKEAQTNLQHHIDQMKQDAKFVYEVDLSESLNGTFIKPTVFELDHINALKREVFGPVLHIIRFDAKNLDGVIDQINSTGYGLTFGIHSRIDETIKYFQERIRVGNIYVNRNIVGAVVGVQPFGGEGLSGTGPKAGGPLYLYRLAIERTISVDTTASGGNASLMTLNENG